MKKISLLLVVSILLLSSILLTSCGGIGLAQVQDDPFEYVEKGMKLTFSNTPFASLTEEGKQASVDFSVEEGENRIQVKAFMDQEAGKLYMNGKYKEVFDFEGETDTTELDLGLWFADNKLIVKNEYLKELFGSDAIGVDLGASKETIKKSSLYQAILTSLGINGEELTDDEKAVLEAVEKEIEALISKIKESAKDVTVLDGVAEEKINVGEKEVDTIVVSFKLKDKLVEDIADAFVAFANEINKAMGSEDTVSREDLALPTITQNSKYYLAKDSGAVVRSEMITATKVPAVDGAEASESLVSYSIDYGAKPQKEFLPAFSYESKNDEAEITVSGASSYKDGNFVLDMSCKQDGEDDGTAVFTLEANGNFSMTVSDDDGEDTVTGTLKNEDKTVVLTAVVPADEEEEDSKETKITLKIGTSAEIPATPEFKDLFSLTEDDVAGILDAFGLGPVDYASMYYSELLYYLNTTETQLDALLADYATYGYASREDYIYAAYAQYAYQDLVTNYGVTSAELDQYLNTVVNENSTYLELAIAVDDAYYALVMNEA